MALAAISKSSDLSATTVTVTILKETPVPVTSDPPISTVTVAISNGTAFPITSASGAWSTPIITNILDEYLTISITNLYGTPLSLSFGSNAGGPLPVGNPSSDMLLNASPTQYTFPTGWAGRIGVGTNLNSNSSKIESSFVGPPDIDVSYVDGYSVPITCSSEGIAASGCNIELFQQPGIKCEDQVDGPICINPIRAQNLSDGPAPEFFAACAGAAYTYPNDNDANVSNLGSNLISCCIGTSCEAPSRQSLERDVLIH
ncbi:hypothetical protein MMC14_010448 [Varicellaria rhodocarpa]|nr:hypothetical protein [Varicellaria rhodocarpa]